MDYSINSRPLLQESENSEVEEDILDDGYSDGNERTPREHPEPEIVRFSQNVPVDKYNFTYIIFYLLGMTTLIPWNFFITAEDYWMFKFRNVTSNTTSMTTLQKDITSDLSVAAAIPNTLFLIVNAFISHLIPLKIRMVGSMSAILVFFLITTGFVEVNTDSWQTGFFALTITTLVIMNIFAAILGGGLFGIAGLFPSEYITALVSGQALGGIFTALADIISLTFAASAKTTAFVYFSVGNFLLVVSLVCYIIMSRTVFFRHFVFEKTKKLHPSPSCEPIKLDGYDRGPNFREIFRKIYLYAVSEWFVFVVTLSVYPAITVLVQSQYHGNGHLWNDIYFTPVVNYLLFNSGDYLGRILAGIFIAPKNKPHLVLLFCVARAGFVPIFMMSNTNPHSFLPTVVTSDVAFIVSMVFFAISNGYIANISLIMAPRVVMQHEKEMASSIMAACLGLGLAFGSLSSLFLVQLL